jgi:cell division protein FtsW
MLALLGLTCTGLLMVYSASIADSYTVYGSSLTIFQHEILWVALGCAALAAAVRIDYRLWQRVSLPFFALCLLLLVLVLAPHFGHSANGARRWIALSSSLELEPSELIKLALVLHLSAWLALKGDRVRDFKATFVPFGLVIGLVAMLILKQPDLGTTIVVTVTVFSVMFVAGASLTHFSAVAAGAFGVGLLLMQGESYRTGRLTAFLNPWSDPRGVGYHTVQALLALGSGGLTGRGLGNSAQKFVLPAPHTDSILAVIGEEWGLIGTLAVLLLFIVVAYRGIRIALNAPDTFSRLAATGVTCWITFQALLNFAVITSSVPFTGVPLPFVSYGGTSQIITMTAVGILLNISRHSPGQALARYDSDNGRGNGGTRVPRPIDPPLPRRGRGAPEPRPGPKIGRPRSSARRLRPLPLRPWLKHPGAR